MEFRLVTACVKHQVIEKSMRDKRQKHNAKLYKLWKKQHPMVPDCIVNLSSRKLNLSEYNALLFGLNHHIFPSRIDPAMVRAGVESQINRICRRM